MQQKSPRWANSANSRSGYPIICAVSGPSRGWPARTPASTPLLDIVGDAEIRTEADNNVRSCCLCPKVRGPGRQRVPHPHGQGRGQDLQAASVAQ